MTSSRLNAVIKNRRTTATWFQNLILNQALSEEQVLLIINHQNATMSTISDLLLRYGKYFRVSEAIAKRSDIVSEHVIEQLSNILIQNQYHWNKDAWDCVMKAFKVLISSHYLSIHSEMLYLTYDDCEFKFHNDDAADSFNDEDAAHTFSFHTPYKNDGITCEEWI